MWSSVGREREVCREATLTKNISPESSHTCSVNSPLEDCHAFYFKVLCLLCSSVAPSNSSLWCGELEMKIMGPGIGLLDFKSWLCMG